MIKLPTYGITKIAGILAVAILFSACRGKISEKPPIHPNMNMDQQPRKEAQEVNTFFEDNRSMRQPVEGTVARGLKKDDLAYYKGVDANGNWVEEIPVEVTKSFLYRGKDRYEIFCTPCHGITGDGRGIIMTGQYGYVPAPTYHSDRLRNAPDGQLYSAIYDGIRNMPSYATQIPVEDRWAIVSYIRALQESQNVPEDVVREYDVDLAALQDSARKQLEAEAQLAEAEAQAAEEAGETAAPPVSIDIGKQAVAQNGCAACHNITGEPGGIGPTWKGLFGSEAEVITASGETITVTKDEKYIRESIINPEAKKQVDYAQGVMVSYGYLPDNEIESIIEYIKSLSDN